MLNEPPQVFKDISALGVYMRERRRHAGFSNLESGAKAFSVGKRFLAELERGKPTAEIGKVVDVLHGLGLDLAVVPRQSNTTHAAQALDIPRSETLGLDFPYDWSNSGMSEDVFIHSVLKKARFMDIMRLVQHYGIASIETAAQAFADDPCEHRLTQILARIRIGYAKANA